MPVQLAARQLAGCVIAVNLCSSMTFAHGSTRSARNAGVWNRELALVTAFGGRRAGYSDSGAQVARPLVRLVTGAHVRELFVDRLTAEQLEAMAGIAATVLRPATKRRK